MRSRSRSILKALGLLVVLVVVIVGARLLGSRSTDESAARVEAQARAAGVVNRLSVVNMLDVPVRLSITGVDLAQWGRTPPDDEPPAGLEAVVIEPHRVSDEVGLRPLRIVDGGGDATFTIDVLLDDMAQSRTRLATVPTRSTTLEYCGQLKCFDGYGWFDWQDAPDPPLDVFRKCIVDERLVGTFIDRGGVTREIHAAFQCDASKFQSALVLSQR